MIKIGEKHNDEVNTIHLYNVHTVRIKCLCIWKYRTVREIMEIRQQDTENNRKKGNYCRPKYPNYTRKTR